MSNAVSNSPKALMTKTLSSLATEHIGCRLRIAASRALAIAGVVTVAPARAGFGADNFGGAPTANVFASVEESESGTRASAESIDEKARP